MENPVTLHRAVVALRAPVGEKVLHRVGRAGLPELIGLSSVAGDEGIKKMFGGFLFRVVAERKPQRDNRDYRKRRDGEGHGPGFIWFIGRRIDE